MGVHETVLIDIELMASQAFSFFWKLGKFFGSQSSNTIAVNQQVLKSGLWET